MRYYTEAGEEIMRVIAKKLRREVNMAYERAALLAEKQWDSGLSGVHGGEQANRTALAIRQLKEEE